MESMLIDIPTAITTRGHVSVIGVVVDSLSPKRMGGTSYCVTFTLKDCDINNGHTADGLKIKYFNDDQNLLPPLQVGDVVSVRNIRVGCPDGPNCRVLNTETNVDIPAGQDI